MARRSRKETHQLIVSTGVRLLLENGLRGGCDHVGMAEVLTTIERDTGQRITNASVYGRIWPKQSDFHRELLLAAAEFYPNGEEAATLESARAILDRADLSTSQARARALREICRQSGAAHVVALSASRAWQTWLAIWAITVSTPSMDDDLERGPAIASRHEHAVRNFAEVFEEVLPRLRYRARPGVDLAQAAMAIYALSEGLALHDRFAPEQIVTLSLPSGRNDQMQPWTLFAVGVEALLTRFVEPF